jgi:CheY-like chemotaxis protein
VKNGPEAIALLELLKSEIELVIMEAEFPVENGFDLIGRLMRRSQPTPVKIMVTTSDDRPLSPQFVRGSGVDAVVCKPVRAEEWRKTLDAVLTGEPG